MGIHLMPFPPAIFTGTSPAIDPLESAPSRGLDWERALAGCVVLVAFLTSLIWAATIPFNAAPDEIHHYNMDWYIAVHGQLPIFDKSPEIHHTQCLGPTGPCYSSYASLPPGSPLLGALLMKIQHTLTGTSYGSYREVIVGGQAPAGPMVLAARLVSALAITVYVLFLYLLACLLFEDRFTRLTALSIGALIPQVTFLGGYVNDDSVGLAAGSAVLYLSIRMLRHGLSRNMVIGSGVALAALVSSKIDYYLIFLVFAGCMSLRLREEVKGGAGKRFLGRLALTGGIAILLSGWWLVRNINLYGDAFGFAVLWRHVDAIAPGFASHTMLAQGGTFITLLRHTQFAKTSFYSWWGVFDYMTLLMPTWVYEIIFVAVVGSLVGVVRVSYGYWERNKTVRSADAWLAISWTLLLSLIPLAIVQSMWNSLSNAYQPQGRYLFPALVPAVLLLAAGVQGWSDRETYRRVALGAVTAGMLGLNIGALLFVVAPAYLNW